MPRSQIIFAHPVRRPWIFEKAILVLSWGTAGIDLQ